MKKKYALIICLLASTSIASAGLIKTIFNEIKTLYKCHKLRKRGYEYVPVTLSASARMGHFTIKQSSKKLNYNEKDIKNAKKNNGMHIIKISFNKKNHKKKYHHNTNHNGDNEAIHDFLKNQTHFFGLNKKGETILQKALPYCMAHEIRENEPDPSWKKCFKGPCHSGAYWGGYMRFMYNSKSKKIICIENYNEAHKEKKWFKLECTHGGPCDHDCYLTSMKKQLLERASWEDLNPE